MWHHLWQNILFLPPWRLFHHMLRQKMFGAVNCQWNLGLDFCSAQGYFIYGTNRHVSCQHFLVWSDRAVPYITLWLLMLAMPAVASTIYASKLFCSLTMNSLDMFFFLCKLSDVSKAFQGSEAKVETSISNMIVTLHSDGEKWKHLTSV